MGISDLLNTFDQGAVSASDYLKDPNRFKQGPGGNIFLDSNGQPVQTHGYNNGGGGGGLFGSGDLVSGFHDTVSHLTAGGVAGGLWGGGIIGGAAGTKIGADAGEKYQAGLSAQPDTSTPPAPPTLGQTNLTALGGQLSYEQRARAASTILTGGAGLTDEPTTASQVLLGS